MSKEDKDIYKDESDESKFNAGISTLMRLHEIKKWLAISTLKEDHTKIYLLLKCLWKELDCQFPDSKTKNIRAEQRDEYLKMRDSFNKYKSNQINKAEFLELLDKWDINLRELDQEYGLNMPKKDDDDGL